MGYNVVHASTSIERGFAEQLEKNEAVKVYAKLPSWIMVHTLMGTYIPHLAVLVGKDSEERLYTSSFSPRALCSTTTSVDDHPPRSMVAKNLDDRLMRE